MVYDKYVKYWRDLEIIMFIKQKMSLKVIENGTILTDRYGLILYRFYRASRTDERTDGQNCYINIARQCADAR